MIVQPAFSLFDLQGERKYLNRHERQRFYEGTLNLSIEKMLFCQMFYHTGARLSEVSDLTVGQIDFDEKLVVFRTLKRRRNNVYRQVPLPDNFMGSVLAFVDVSRRSGNMISDRLWTFTSRTGSRAIKQVMNNAKIEGVKASALGLRHGFAVNAVTVVPLTLVQKWMGHVHLSTTGIYLQVSGIEEREWMEKVW